MGNILGGILGSIDKAGGAFSEHAYGYVAEHILPLLMTLVMIYVAYYGFQLITGTASIQASDFLGRIVRVVLILALVMEWDNFDALFFQTLNQTPEAVGKALLIWVPSEVRDPVSGLSEVWNTANRAASTYSGQTGHAGGLTDLTGLLLIAVAGLFVGTALAILILAKVMLWVLVGTAPIFIACMLFEQTRDYGRGWINQVLVYAITPMLVYVVAAFLLDAMRGAIGNLEVQIANENLMLSDFAVFFLLCIAGAIVLAQVQVHAHGIVRAVGSGTGQSARRTAGWISARRAVGRGSASQHVQTWQQDPAWQQGNAVQYRVTPVYADGTESMSAMQNRISANSMPREVQYKNS